MCVTIHSTGRVSYQIPNPCGLMSASVVPCGLIPLFLHLPQRLPLFKFLKKRAKQVLTVCMSPDYLHGLSNEPGHDCTTDLVATKIKNLPNPNMLSLTKSAQRMQAKAIFYLLCVQNECTIPHETRRILLQVAAGCLRLPLQLQLWKICFHIAVETKHH